MKAKPSKWKAVESVEEPTELPTKREQKSAFRPASNPAAEPTVAEPSAAESAPPEALIPAAPRKKKKRRRHEPTNVPSEWLAWVDPVVFLWLPILVPVLTFGSIAIGMGLAMQPVVVGEAGFTGLGTPFILAGGLLAGIPWMYVLRHMSEILRTWALDGGRDPRWDEFHVGEMFAHAFQWFAAAVWTAPLITLVVLLPQASILHQNALLAVPALALATLLAWLYFSITLLAITLNQSVLGGNPLAVVVAMFRIGHRSLGYVFESLIHIAVFVGIFWLMMKGWGVSSLLAAPVIVLFWGALILSLSRLMRLLGTLHRQNCRRIGWFG